MPKWRSVAWVSDAMIQAVLQATYRFAAMSDALDALHTLMRTYELSRAQPLTLEEGIIFWVRDYDVSPEEEKDGYLGHFMHVRVAEEAGLFVLRGEKYAVELKYHPQQKRHREAHPNWGHPVMRAIKRKKIYPTLEAAQAELDVLHADFPAGSIPNAASLRMMVYERVKGKKKPDIVKYAMAIASHPTQGFYIEAKIIEKAKKPKPAPKAAAIAPSKEKAAPDQKGAFMRREDVRRARKRKPQT